MLSHLMDTPYKIGLQMTLNILRKPVKDKIFMPGRLTIYLYRRRCEIQPIRGQEIANMTTWLSGDVICMRFTDRMTAMMIFQLLCQSSAAPCLWHIECAQNAQFYAPTKALKKEFWL